MRLAVTLLLLALCLAGPPVAGQPFLAPGGQNQGLNGFNGGFNRGGPNNQPGQQGGGSNADFESLIDLIVSTVAPNSWAENGGGEAEIRPYVGGVYADPTGLLRRVRAAAPGSVATDLERAHARLASVHQRTTRPAKRDANADPRLPSPLRCISLARLERELERRKIAGQPVEEAMLTLAGLQRVQYVVLLPPESGQTTGDVILAGPAGDWRMVGDGRIVSTKGGSIVRLDDLLTLLRRGWSGPASPFGCSINPRRQSLAAAQDYLHESASKPVAPGKRKAWLAGLRAAVGRQDIEVFGVDPTSRAAGVLVEADHHMKLIGMGLARGEPGVESYLDRLAKSREAASASGGVLRWWFAMNYSAVHASPQGDAFELVGPGAKVMSETEMLTVRGGRVPAGQADEFAEAFASSFTQHFGELCRKYPVYAELRNLFDLALAVEIARAAHEADPQKWSPTTFAKEEHLPLPKYEPARTVETVVSHRVVNRRRFVAGVSGGVWSDPRSVLSERRQVVAKDVYGPLGKNPVKPPAQQAKTQLDKTQPAEQIWWWDAE